MKSQQLIQGGGVIFCSIRVFNPSVSAASIFRLHPPDFIGVGGGLIVQNLGCTARPAGDRSRISARAEYEHQNVSRRGSVPSVRLSSNHEPRELNVVTVREART
jgi:hypothetical protein